MAQQRPVAPLSFPSPGAAPENDYFTNAVTHAKALMKGYPPAVLRQAVRELWELTLDGSEYHSTFICSTMYHRAPPGTLSRTVEQHGARLVRNSASQLAKHLRREDLDMMAPILMPKFSNTFLDKALALRLESIQAQQLVNALGRAERLGYDVRDVVTGSNQADGPARQERVIPTANPIPAPSTSLLPRPPPPPPSPSQQQQQPAPATKPPSGEDILRLGIAYCDDCNRPCGGIKALLSHRRSGLCGTPPVPLHKFGKEFCLFCGQRFLGNGGLTYHRNNSVCGIYSGDHAQFLMASFADAEQAAKMTTNTVKAPTPKPRHAVVAAASSQSTPQSAAAAAKDPYAALTPTMRLALDVALTRVEHQYAEDMKKALLLPPGLQKAEMARLKNLYNNKQSMTRKKFGIRLRERRSKSEIDDERSRMLSTDPKSPVTPGGRRTHSEVTGSASRQGTPKTVLLTEMGNGERTGSVSMTPVMTPATLPPSAPARPPLPMSIAGSHTAPVRAPDAPASKAYDPEPIEIDDLDEYEEVEVDLSVEEDKNTEKSSTEMDIDEDEDSPNQDTN